MYPELDQFNQIKQEYENQIEQLKERQKSLQKEKAEASRQYNKVLSKVVYDGDSDSAIELAEKKNVTKELEQEFKNNKEQIEQLQRSKNERLSNLLSSLKEGRDREFDAAEKHMKKKKEDLLRYRAEYLLLIQQLYEIRKYAQEVDTVFKKTVKPLTHDYEYVSQSLPAVNLHNPFGEEDPLGILETEVQQVYKTGKLPDWVKEYSRD